MSTEIDHRYTDNIICPWCGRENIDSWEVQPDVGDDTCPDCKKSFTYSRKIDVKYCTSKLEQS